MYERGDVLTLSNGVRYIVVTTVPYKDKNYIYLVNEENNADLMFCEYENEEFERVTDVNLVLKLAELISPEMNQILEELSQ